MVTRRRRTSVTWMLVWGLLVTGVAVAALASIWTTADSVGNAADPQARTDFLQQVAHRLIPAPDGGWVVAQVDAEPAPDRWLLAATALPRDRTSGELDAAFAAARSAVDGDDHDLARSSAHAVATGLGSPGDLPAGSDAAGSSLLVRTLHELEGGGSGWLGVLLQLSAAPGPTGEAATAELRSRVGDAGCDRLPSARQPMPAPSSSLTVLLRTLAGEHRECPGAAAVLDRALDTPAWNVPIALPELADLATVSGALTTGQRSRLGAYLEAVVMPTDDTVADLTILALLGRARQVAGIPHDLPADVRLRLQNQVANEGRLADRSTSPATAFDVAVLRQADAIGAVPDGILESTTEAAATTRGGGSESAERRVHDFLLLGRVPACDARHAAPASGKVTMVAVLEDQLLRVTRAHCAGRLDLDQLLGDAQALGSIEASPRLWITVLAACQVDRTSISPRSARAVDASGSFADDPLWLAAAAALADPVATCEAERGS